MADNEKNVFLSSSRNFVITRRVQWIETVLIITNFDCTKAENQHQISGPAKRNALSVCLSSSALVAEAHLSMIYCRDHYYYLCRDVAERLKRFISSTQRTRRKGRSWIGQQSVFILFHSSPCINFPHNISFMCCSSHRGNRQPVPLHIFCHGFCISIVVSLSFFDFKRFVRLFSFPSFCQFSFCYAESPINNKHTHTDTYMDVRTVVGSRRGRR